jgi:dTDP-glucose pyrophosphorylase
VVSGSNHTRPTDRWREALLPATATLQEGIRNLDESTLQIALVTGPDGVLLGTLTDGDVRRGLLRGLALTSGIDSVVHRGPLVVPAELGSEAVMQLMRANRLRQLPIVDAAGRVVGLHLWDELASPTSRASLMVIMAGGAGVRLRPHTENCPKPLLPIGDKPILEHILLRARAEGFTRFVVALHYLGHMIRDYFGDGSAWQVSIDYVTEEDPLGTAGAIGLLSPRPEEAFMVTNGDVLTDVRYGDVLEFHLRHQASATMAVRAYEWQNPFGVVHTDGVDIVGFEEKPVTRSHINAGVYVLEPRALDVLRTGERCDMPGLFSRLQTAGARTIVYPMHEPWLDIGRHADLKQAQSDIR